MSGQATLSFGGDTILLQPAELDRLLRSLRQIQSRAAASMAEEISARTLTGGYRELCPTEAELEALVSALVRLRGVAQDLSALPRLLALVQEHQARPQPRQGRSCSEDAEPAVHAVTRDTEGIEEAAATVRIRSQVPGSGVTHRQGRRLRPR
jgi:hypothetical protein